MQDRSSLGRGDLRNRCPLGLIGEDREQGNPPPPYYLKLHENNPFKHSINKYKYISAQVSNAKLTKQQERFSDYPGCSQDHDFVMSLNLE